MKLKFLVAALGLIASAASQAQILQTNNPGNTGSDLLLDVWEQGASNGAPDQSFTLNLNETLTQFLASDTTSSTLATLSSGDSTWTNFLASSSAADLQWSVIASGNKLPTRAGTLATVTAGEDVTTFAINNLSITSANTALNTVIDNLNVQATPNESVNIAPSPAYYQQYNLGSFGQNIWDNGNVLGATGVQVATLNAIAGTAATVVAPVVLTGTMSFAQGTNGNYVLNYVAVPEAPGFAVMLAGLGALTLLARRRKGF